MLEPIVTWLQDLIETVGPIGIGIATAIESLIAPIPSEVVLITAGTTITTYQSLVIFIISATIGSYIGTLPFYYIGTKSKKVMYNIIERWGKYIFLTTEQVERAEKLFQKRGSMLVLTGRLIPGIRSIVSIPAGICHMNFSTYTLYTLTGSLIWNTILLSSGYFLGDTLIDIIKSYEKIILLMLLILVVSYLGFQFVKSRKQ